MNFIAIVAVVFGCVALSYQADDHAEIHAKMMQYATECIKESGVNPELPKKAFVDGDFPNDKNLKCFFKCMYQKTGHMNDAGVVDMDSMKAHIPEGPYTAKVTAAIDKCKGLKGADPCETAFDISKCMRDDIGPIKHTTNAPGR